MHLESQFVTVDGVRYHYLDWGGTGPPMVLIHCMGLSSGMWHLVAPTFTKQFRVLGIDMRGHGLSDKPETGYEWRSLGEQLAMILKALNLQQVVLIGHSMGGALASVAAALIPERIQTIILVDPVIRAREKQFQPVTNQPRNYDNRRNNWADREEVRQWFQGRGMFTRWLPQAMDLYLEYCVEEDPESGVRLCCPPATEARIATHARADLWDLLPFVPAPILIVSPDETNVCPPDQAEILSGRFPNAQVGVIQQCGHFVPEEKPELLAKVISDYLFPQPK